MEIKKYVECRCKEKYLIFNDDEAYDYIYTCPCCEQEEYCDNCGEICDQCNRAVCINCINDDLCCSCAKRGEDD